jgi:hypothetical protein
MTLNLTLEHIIFFSQDVAIAMIWVMVHRVMKGVEVVSRETIPCTVHMKCVQ